MGTRKIKDAELGGEKVYFASHAKATYLSDGRDVTTDHEFAIRSLSTQEEVEAYDFRTGYPEKPTFSI